MRTELEQVSEELNALQGLLQGTVNRLWSLKLSLNSAYHHGLDEKDFLPRRLHSLRHEEQRKLDTLLRRLNQVLSGYLGSPILVLDPGEDLDTLLNIHRTIRYLRNAYSSEAPLLQALAKISRALPAGSSH